MTELILHIKKESDLKELLVLLERLNIHYERRKVRQGSGENNLETAIRVILEGGDFSYLGDPAKWQREQRQDREMPHSSTSTDQ